MSNNGLTKNYDAEAAIGAHLFVKPGAADYGVLAAAAPGDAIIGITTEVGATAAGERIDVVHEGIADLKLGGAVTAGAPLTSDASGAGVAAAPAAGVNNTIGARALIAGAAGDIIPVLIGLGSLQG